MEPDPQRERDNPSQRNAEQAWSPYDELAAAEDAKWRRSRRRRSLVGVGVVLLVMCVVGSVVGYIWFARATRIDRDTPAVVVVQYVDAIFTDRDVKKAELFECDGADPKEPLLEQLQLVEDRERQFNILFIIDVTSFAVEELGDKARVKTEIEFVAPMDTGGLSQLRQPWLFEMKDEDGWRVCQASKLDQ